MIERLSKYMAAVAVCAALAGCNDGLQGPDVPTGAGMVTITLKNSNATRSAESDNSETLIKNVVVALYPREYGENRRAVALQRFEGIDKNNSTTVQMKLTDDMVQTLFGGTSGADCNLYAVANVDLSGIPDNATIADLKNIVATSRFNELKVQESFVMAGSGTVTYSQAGGVESATGRGDLVRAAAKISLNIKLPASVTDTDGAEWVPAISSTGGVRAILSNGVKTSVAAPGEDWQTVEDGYYSLTMRNAGLVRELPNSGDGSEYPYHIDVPFYTYPNQWEETPEEQHKTMMTLVVPWQKRGETQWNTYYYQVPVTNLTKIVSNYSYVVNLNVGMLGSLSPETPETLEDLTYQIVNWSTENIDVDIKDTRYLVVSPTEFSVQSQNEIEIPIYSSHPIEVYEVSLKYNRYAFVNQNGYEDTGKQVTFTITDGQIKLSNEKNEDSPLCTYRIERNANGQYSLFVKHPLEVWDPYDSDNNPVALTGYRNASDETVAGVQRRISYYMPSDPVIQAYSPYTIDVKVRHIDKNEFNEGLTVVQYPGMYIEADRNPGGIYNSGYTRAWVSTGFWSGYYKYTATTTNYGFAYVNPTYHWMEDNDTNNPNPEPFGYWENSSTLGGLLEITSSSSNKNPNMYVITVTTLFNSEDPYIIGDPRVNYYSNDLSGNNDMAVPTRNDGNEGSWSVSSPALYKENASTTNRQLKYYYPTNESDAYQWMVAPKFRIASSYAEMSSVDRYNCRRRCASYQEQGYPAGRWRMPTYGEMKFIVWLAKTGKIPPLFNTGVYMTAQGAYTVGDDGSLIESSRTSGWVRAVYDEWYWEEEKNYVLQTNSSGGYDFTWGDMPRNLTRSNALINMYKSKNKK